MLFRYYTFFLLFITISIFLIFHHSIKQAESACFFVYEVYNVEKMYLLVMRDNKNEKLNNDDGPLPTHHDVWLL